ncbi:zinc finger protein 473 isoform X2 [Erinaceus europaeus]|uniref:Zinc finger protein 473 isoform X2 n=1 Tax=Erinaceus europaeus TaxID=9365 RepID=A0ABM3W1A3_ERIEU|nr:zinc finger protein 473 isoform X2 [Erinaceus europaeus]
MTEKIPILKGVAMDFTLEDWGQLGLNQGDLFWDKALDNYQNLFLLNPLRSSLTSCPDGVEELEVKGNPEVMGPDKAETKKTLLEDFWEDEELSQGIVELFSKDDLRNSSLEETLIDNSSGPKACMAKTESNI